MLTPRFPVLLLASLCMSPVAVFGQTAASLSGRIVDTSGAALPGVTVTARRADTGFERATTSDVAGRYTLPSLTSR